MYNCELCGCDTEDDLKINKVYQLTFNGKAYQQDFKSVPICRECIKKISCYTCGCKYFLFLDEDNKPYCKTHRLNSSATCPACGEKKKFRHVYLGSCYPKIQSYWFKPVPKFKGNDDLYFGIELEVGGAKSKFNILNFMKDVKKVTDLIYFKRDGSINNYGVEAVSHPATYEFHKNSDIWNNVFISLNKNEIPEDSSCGLHVHVSKRNLSNKQIACIDAFVNTQDEFIREIAGRESNRYCKKIIKETNEWGVSHSSFLNSGRYNSVNLTNPNTIEYRMFASTNDYDVFMNRLKFARNLTLFCKDKELSEVLEKDHILRKFQEFSSQVC